MPITYGHINAAKIAAAKKKPGHSDVALWALMGEFTTIGGVGAYAAAGDSKKVTTAHTFPVGKGFKELQCKTKSIEGGGSSTGEPGGSVMDYKFKVIVKGLSADILEFIENILQEDTIWLFNDPTCGVDDYVQVGSKCSPANISDVAYRGGTKGAGGFQEFEFIVSSSELFFYSGAVTKQTA